MTGNKITRRQLLKKGIRWCGLAAIPGLSSACGGRLAAEERQIVGDAQKLSLKEIAHRKLHHRDGCFLNLFGGPILGI